MVKHNYDCTRVFKNYDKDCPRCQELAQGAKPRESWHKRYFDNKKKEEERFANALKNHDCKVSGCMPICTFGDW